MVEMATTAEEHSEIMGEGQYRDITVRIIEKKIATDSSVIDAVSLSIESRIYGEIGGTKASLDELSNIVKESLPKQTRWLIQKGILTKEFIEKIGDLLEAQEKLIPSIIEALRRALLDLERKKLHLESIKTLAAPRKQEIFIRRLLKEIRKKVPQVFQDGKTRVLCIDCPMSQAHALIKVLSGESEYANPYGEVIDAKKILAAAGLDPDKPQEQPLILLLPHLFIYETSSGELIFSRIPLPEGEVSLYLWKMTLSDLHSLLEDLPQYEQEDIKAIIRKALKIAIAENDDSSIWSYAVETNKLFYADRGLPEKYIKYYLDKDKWKELAQLAFSFDQIDPFITNFYKSLAIPFPREFMDYAPHSLLFTNTNVGKSTLYELVTGEGALSSATPVSLAGGIDPRSKKPFKGIIHGRHKALQIEGLESGQEQETLKLLLDYMKRGVAERAAAGRIIKSVGASPIILTGNVRRTERKRGLTFQALINMGALSNPEALGSRVLPFYLDGLVELRFSRRKKRIIEGAWEQIRAVTDSSTVLRLVSSVWNNDIILSWLEEPDLPLDVEIQEIEGYEDLVSYLKVVREEYYTRLKGLSLNAAIFDYLGELYEAKSTAKWIEVIKKVLAKAQEYYKFFKKYLVESIAELAEDYRRVAAVRWELLPNYVKAFIEGVYRYVIEVNSGSSAEFTIELDQLDEHIERAAEGRIKRPRDAPRLIKKRIEDLIKGGYARVLEKLGIILTISENKVKVRVDPRPLLSFMEKVEEVTGPK